MRNTTSPQFGFRGYYSGFQTLWKSSYQLLLTVSSAVVPNPICTVIQVRALTQVALHLDPSWTVTNRGVTVL